MIDRNPDAAPVLIAGAGIGGLAAARCLSLKGRRSIVLEQAPAFAEVGAGIQLGPNAYKMLERMGLAEQVRELAVFPDDLILMDSVSGTEVSRVPVGEAFRRRFHHPYTLVHRADLHQVLLSACAADEAITLSPGSKLASFAEAGDSVVVQLDDGRSLTGAALIGADGLWSAVREQIVGDGPPLVSGHIAYRAVLPIEDVEPQYRQNAMILWAGPKNHLVQYPLRGGKLFNLVAVFHSDAYVEGWNAAGDPGELKRRFEGTCSTVQTLLAKIDSWRMWVLCDREPVAKWSRGRVTLLGDAAHPMLQYLAQGACQAIEDAVVLADAVDEAHDNYVAAFETYERQRYLRTGKCQISARLYGDVYHASGVARELRNMWLAGRTDEQGLEGMAWIYEGV